MLETVFFDFQMRHPFRREQLYESGCGADDSYDDSYVDTPRSERGTHRGYPIPRARYGWMDGSSNAVNAARTRCRPKAANINLVESR